MTLIGTPLPPALACVNQTWLPLPEKFVPVITIVLPLMATLSIEGLLPEAAP